MYRLVVVYLVVSFAFSSIAQNGLNFDGFNDFASTNVPGPDGMAPRTVELWFNQSATFSSQQVFLTWGEMGTGERFTLNIINGLPRIEVGNSGFSSTTTLPPSTWHHVAATYDPADTPDMKLYVDGVLKASGDPIVPVNTSINGGIVVGRRQDSINYFNGDIDEVRIWDHARSVAEINATKDLSFCTVPPELIHYFPMDQGIAGGNNVGIVLVEDLGTIPSNLSLDGFALNGNNSNWVLGAPVSGSGTSMQTVQICGPYTVPGGNTYTSSGTYVDTLITTTGCTNVTTTALTITPLDTTVVQSGVTLMALATGVTYAWIDCTDSIPIVGATSSTFVPTENGSFAVVVSTPICTETSGCHTITDVGIGEYAANAISVFFNHATGHLELVGHQRIGSVAIHSMTGLLIHQETIDTDRAMVDMGSLAIGTYAMRTADGRVARFVVTQ